VFVKKSYPSSWGFTASMQSEHIKLNSFLSPLKSSRSAYDRCRLFASGASSWTFYESLNVIP